MFSEQKNQTPTKTSSQVIQPLKRPLLQFPQKSASRTTSKWVARMVRPHRLPHPGLQKALHFPITQRRNKKIIQLALVGLDQYPNFLKVP